MLQSSPFVVIYAELLLLAQYIYGMDLNEDELPATTDVSDFLFGENVLEVCVTEQSVRKINVAYS